ncbi:MAG: chromosomal replication initiator protein DnaA [Deltaproteobacteria bacterium]|nr:MAG: chromosomal replication initiator protein DnaA [Deltaproteobacteria bacterium]
MTKFRGWEAVREAVRQRIGVAAYEAWFRSLEGALEGDTLVLRCPDRFSRDWVRERYGPVIQEITPQLRRIEYRIDPEAGRAAPVSRPAEQSTRRQPTPEARPAASFDSFVVGPGNALAVEAARAVARGQAGRCSPLVLAGYSGAGKTHLCQAIRHELRERVLYRSSEEFTTEVTGALRSGQMGPLRQRYRRSLNVLILEDVQFLSGKRATQVELFHTLDHLLAHGKTVVLSAECPPQKIAGLDAKLASRMSSGLVACIAPPGLETRRTILREKAAAGGLRLPEECLETLAARPVQSVRDLLAGLNQVVARAALLRQPVTPELMAEALAAVDVKEQPRSLEEIVALASRSYSVSLEELRGRSRRRRVVRPRQIAMYLCRLYTDASLKEIGQLFRRDPTTVLHAIESVEKRVVEQPQLRYQLETLGCRISPSAPDRSGGGSTRGTRPT